jgi:hypothetical protein
MKQSFLLGIDYWLLEKMEERMDINDIQLAWYICDEAAVKCSSKHIGEGCEICDKIIEAMPLLDKPTPEQCRKLYLRRK